MCVCVFTPSRKETVTWPTIHAMLSFSYFTEILIGVVMFWMMILNKKNGIKESLVPDSTYPGFFSIS